MEKRKGIPTTKHNDTTNCPRTLHPCFVIARFNPHQGLTSWQIRYDFLYPPLVLYPPSEQNGCQVILLGSSLGAMVCKKTKLTIVKRNSARLLGNTHLCIQYILSHDTFSVHEIILNSLVPLFNVSVNTKVSFIRQHVIGQFISKNSLHTPKSLNHSLLFYKSCHFSG